MLETGLPDPPGSGPAETCLVTPEAFLELADVLPDPAVLLDGEGVVLAANRRACALLGAPAQELVGHRLDEQLRTPPHELDRFLLACRSSGEEVPGTLHTVLGEEPLRCRGVRLRRPPGAGVQILVRVPSVSTAATRFALLNEKIDQLGAEVRRRERGERALAEQLELAAFGRDVGLALSSGGSLHEMLQRCAEHVVEHLDAAFARVWTLGVDDGELVLRASAGMYTHLDGEHARIPVGRYKIGLIAAEGLPHLTNSVVGDERVHDQAWARREGMVAFAGYPLVVEGRVVGVMAAFARHALSETTLEAMASVATAVASGIERKRIEADLVRHTELLQRADRRKDEFLAMLGHELRNPLAPLRTGLELVALGKVSERTVETMRDQVSHLVRLVDDLLDVSRITSGKIELQREPVSIGELIEAAVETTQNAIESRGHELSVQLSDAMVDADRVRLVQVLTNLLQNAVKYTPRGGHIALEAESERGEVVVRCRDDGVGMEPELLEDAFELFTQGERSLDRSGGGLGIGLALARRLVELHGGTLRATSAGRGRGSEFVLRLPRAAPVGAAPDPAEVEAATSDRRVLVVDDNRDAADTLQALIAVLGRYRVSVAYDGLEALRAAESSAPDVVLLDIGLPEMDGFEVARRMRADPRLGDTLLVALTGYGSEQDRAASRAVGFDLHCVKPVTAADLRWILQQKRDAASR